MRWLDEKEHKRSLNDDKVKIEFFLQHLAGRDIATITCEEVQKIVGSMINRNHCRKWEIHRNAAIRDEKPIPAY